MKKLFVSLLAFFAIALAMPAQTANFLVQFSNFGLKSNAVRSVTIKPQYWTSSQSTFYVADSATISVATYPAITNGSCVFSNFLTGIPYQLTMSGYSTWTTNFLVGTNETLDSNGNFNVAQRVGFYVNPSTFFYASTIFTNVGGGSATNVVLTGVTSGSGSPVTTVFTAAGSNIISSIAAAVAATNTGTTTLGGTNTVTTTNSGIVLINVPQSKFDAKLDASSVTNGATAFNLQSATGLPISGIVGGSALVTNGTTLIPLGENGASIGEYDGVVYFGGSYFPPPYNADVDVHVSGYCYSTAGFIGGYAGFIGNATGLSNLNASALSSGTVPLPRLPSEVLTNAAAFDGAGSAQSVQNNFTNTLNGYGLTIQQSVYPDSQFSIYTGDSQTFRFIQNSVLGKIQLEDPSGNSTNVFIQSPIYGVSDISIGSSNVVGLASAISSAAIPATNLTGIVPMGRLALGSTNTTAGMVAGAYFTDGTNRWTSRDGQIFTNLNLTNTYGTLAASQLPSGAVTNFGTWTNGAIAFSGASATANQIKIAGDILIRSGDTCYFPNINSTFYGSLYGSTSANSPIIQPVSTTNLNIVVGNNLGTMTVRAATANISGTLTVTNGIYYPSNAVTAAAITAGFTNGAFWTGTISNSLQCAWMSNNVVQWKQLAP